MIGALETQWFTVQEVGDRIYAATARPGTGAGSNAGIVDLGGCTLVFDSMMTPAAGEALRSAAEDITEPSVRYLVLSHRDYDHVLGAQAFADCAVIATERRMPWRAVVSTALLPPQMRSARKSLRGWPEKPRRRRIRRFGMSVKAS